MSDRGEGSIIGRLAYSVGFALGRADSITEPTAGTEPPAGPGARPGPEMADGVDHYPSPKYTGVGQNDLSQAIGPSAAIAVGTIAAGWLAGKLIRPRPINWPRAIIAGVTATALADLTQYLSGSAEREGADVPFPPTLDDLPRYAAGIATAAAYGAQIYPRLPGSSLTRGLIFGTVEASLSEDGGTLGLLQRFVPQLELPLSSMSGYASTPRTPIANLAFGLGLGLYSSRSGRR